MFWYVLYKKDISYLLHNLGYFSFKSNVQISKSQVEKACYMIYCKTEVTTLPPPLSHPSTFLKDIILREQARSAS